MGRPTHLNLIFAAVLSLSGCAAVQYQHPQDSNSPTLMFVNKSKADVAVVGYADALSCTKQVNISKQGSRYMDLSSRKSEQIPIRANEKFSFLVSIRSFPKECFMIGTLTPSYSGNYKATIDFDGNRCYLMLTNLQDGIETPEKTFVPRVFKMPFSDSFPACADKLN